MLLQNAKARCIGSVGGWRGSEVLIVNSYLGQGFPTAYDFGGIIKVKLAVSIGKATLYLLC